jgi:hypothetical protein
MGFTGTIKNIKGGVRWYFGKGDSTWVGLRLLGTPASTVDLKLPLTALPGSTSALTVDNTGQLAYAALGGGGSVTSIGVAVPADLAVSPTTITTAGTFTISRNSQPANQFLASPSGAAGVPGYRAIAAADIPQLLSSKISDFDTQVRTNRLDQMAAPTGPVALSNQRITGLGAPTASTDAATKDYVDAIASTGNNKGTARVATTGGIALTSATTTTVVNSGGLPTTLDGVTLATGDLILIKDLVGAGATGAAANGLYVYAAGSTWTRAANADVSAEVTPGLFVFVSEGTANGNNGYTLTTDGPIVLGTTQLTFTQTSGAGQIVGGDGLVLTGNVLDVGGTANRIAVTASTVDIAATYAGQASITTLGTITTGTWNGTAIALGFGGTGASTAAGARNNLGAAGVFRQAFTNANLTSGILTVTHGLGQQFVSPTIYDENNKAVEPDDITATNSTTLTIDLSSFGTISGTWNLVVVG